MFKRIYVEATLPDGSPTNRLIPSMSRRTLEKTAAGLYAPVGEFVSTVKPDPAKLVFLSTALGALSGWGFNRNGDGFPDETLQYTGDDYGIGTFKTAGVYAHHINQDPSKSIGQIIFVVYNPMMKRVELIIAIDRAKAKLQQRDSLLQSLDGGIPTPFSMGCKVPNDKCSVCGHLARVRVCPDCSSEMKKLAGGHCDHEYCDHAATQLGQVLPDGRAVGVLNLRPKFHDYSEVTVPADSIAYPMRKVAATSTFWSLPSTVIAESFGEQDVVESPSSLAHLGKLARAAKSAAMMKEVPLEAMHDMAERETPLPTSVVDGMCGDVPAALSSLTALGILLSKPEFQRLMLMAAGKIDEAQAYDDQNLTFSSVVDATSTPLGGAFSMATEDVNPVIIKVLLPYVNGRSMFEPIIGKRVAQNMEMPKTAGLRPLMKVAPPLARLCTSKDPVLNKVAVAYACYRDSLLEALPRLAKWASTNERVVSTLLGTEDILSAYILHRNFPLQKQAAIPVRVPEMGELLLLASMYPIAYLYAAHLKERERRGEPLGVLRKMIAEHPFLSASSAVTAAKVLPYVRLALAEGVHLPKTAAHVARA